MAEDDVVLLPRFIKAFFSQTSAESFAIPKTFMVHLHDPLPRKAKLRGTGGGVWTVRLKKIREEVYFTDGWSKFAEDHNLKDIDFLTFVYDRHLTFEVNVYNRWGYKENRAVAKVVELSDSSEENGEEEALIAGDDVEVEDNNIHAIHLLEDATGNSEDVAIPPFVAKRKRRIYEMLVPAKVVKTHKLKFGESIKYVDEDGSFVSGRAKYKDDRVCFLGWEKVWRRNSIKKGDTVKCELIHIRKVVHSIKIHITRGGAA